MSNPNNPDNPDKANSGEIVPKLEPVSDDDERCEPSRKRPRNAENVRSSGEIIENLVAEAVEKNLKSKRIEESIKDVHQATLNISDFTISQCGRLEERIQGMETQNVNDKGQLENHIQMLEIGVILKQVNSQKAMEEKLKARFEIREKEIREVSKRVEKLEESKLAEKMSKLKERILKMELENSAVKTKNEILEERMDQLEEDYIQKGILRIVKQEKEIQELKTKNENLELKFAKLEEQVLTMETDIKEVDVKNQNLEMAQKESSQKNENLELKISKLEEKILVMDADIVEVKVKNQNLEIQQKELIQKNELLTSENNQKLENRLDRIQKMETWILELKENSEIQQNESRQKNEQLHRLKEESIKTSIENQAIMGRVLKLENIPKMSQEGSIQTILDERIKKMETEILELQTKQKNATLENILEGVQKAIIENQTSIKKIIPEYREKITNQKLDLKNFKKNVGIKLQVLESELKDLSEEFSAEKIKMAGVDLNKTILECLETRISILEEKNSDFFMEKLKIQDVERDSVRLKEKLEELERSSTDNMEETNEKIDEFESAIWDFATGIKKKVEEIQKHLQTGYTEKPKVQTQGTGYSSSTAPKPLLSDLMPPTPTELNFNSRCIFCNTKNHKSFDCGGVSQVSGRIRVLSEKQNRCTKCLEVVDDWDSHVCSREHTVCSNCQWDPRQAREQDFHHPLVCPMNDRSLAGKKKRDQENGRRRRHGLPPRFGI